MKFHVPAAAAEAATAFPPETGRYPVTLLEFEDNGKTDRNGVPRPALVFKFPNGATARAFLSVPFDDDGNVVPSLAAMDDKTRNNKLNFYVEQIKEVAYSAGFDDAYMNEHGIPSEFMLGKTAYVEWLGRPDDVPQGIKAYGDLKGWLTPAEYEQKKSDPLEDPRTFAWRTSTAPVTNGGSASGGRELPPPPPKGNKKLPPPPSR